MSRRQDDWFRPAVMARARRAIRPRMTQAALAKKVGVIRGSIARLEGGTRRPSVRLLKKIAAVLGIDVTEMM